MRGKKAIFAGCARDCAEPLPAVLRNIDTLSRLFDEAAFLIAENDSKDATKQLLQDWGKTRSGFRLVCMDGLGLLPFRTVRLALARNTYLEIIRSSRLSDFDYLFVMDMDGVNERELDPHAVERCLEFLEADARHAGMMANQSGIYYDLWGLRHATRCPRDVWEEVLEYAIVHSCADEEAFKKAYSPRIFSLPADAAPLEVSSAFGGLAIYKLPYALASAYAGKQTKTIKSPPDQFHVSMQVCEHVAFNERITKQGGRLFIAPWLVNWDTQNDEVWFAPSFFRELIIQEDG
jgi:hypothetical protein